MKLSLKAMALTSGLFWGGAMLLSGAINMRAPRYARPFLKLMASVYPGYKASGRGSDVLVGGAYAFADGALGGLLFGLLYNRLAGGEPRERSVPLRHVG